MKKFTKGCLITALVLFVFGLAFYGICGMMGGFGQLKAWNGHTFRLWGHDMRLAYSGYGFWYITDDDTGMNFGIGIMDEIGGGIGLEAGTKEKVKDSDSGVRKLEIECGGSNLVIQESEDDYIWVARDQEAWPVKYKLQNGIFKLYSEKNLRWWNWEDLTKRTVYLYLPKDMSLESIDLELGAGTLESIALEADEIDVELGAGTAVIESLYGNEIDLFTGAGSLEVGEITADDLSAEAGAGMLFIQSFSADKVEMNVSAGSLEAEGTIGRNADLECGVGSMNLILHGAETDYDYEIECAVGEIILGDNSYSGLSSERTIRNGGRSVLDIECAMGSVVIDFVD